MARRNRPFCCCWDLPGGLLGEAIFFVKKKKLCEAKSAVLLEHADGVRVKSTAFEFNSLRSSMPTWFEHADGVRV